MTMNGYRTAQRFALVLCTIPPELAHRGHALNARPPVSYTFSIEPRSTPTGRESEESETACEAAPVHLDGRWLVSGSSGPSVG